MSNRGTNREPCLSKSQADGNEDPPPSYESLFATAPATEHRSTNQLNSQLVSGSTQAGGNLVSPPQVQSINNHPPTEHVSRQQPVVITQPRAGQQRYGATADGWMASPAQVPVNIPRGLEYLTTIDELLIKQEIEFWEVPNKYAIKNNRGQKVYYAVEDKHYYSRLSGARRKFEIQIMDNSGTEVIHLSGNNECPSCSCSYQDIEVYAPPGNLIGTVRPNADTCSRPAEFYVANEQGFNVFTISAPADECCFCGEVDFNILSTNTSAVVGKIEKQWSGFLREFFTDSDYFGISFPLDLDVRMKAVMIGACILIDFIWFERE